MNTRRDRLDEAIDRVATRMTNVAEDPALAQRIADRLPERSAWSWHWLMPRLAVVGVLVAGGSLFVLTNVWTSVPADTQTRVPADVRTNGETSVQTTVPQDAHANVFSNARLNDRLSNRANDRPNDVPDFDRSLPALDAASLLTFDALAPVSLAEDALLTLEPLAIADLPLTAEADSPR